MSTEPPSLVTTSRYFCRVGSTVRSSTSGSTSTISSYARMRTHLLWADGHGTSVTGGSVRWICAESVMGRHAENLSYPTLCPRWRRTGIEADRSQSHPLRPAAPAPAAALWTTHRAPVHGAVVRIRRPRRRR
ncbi:hypothetical protein ACFFX0_16985 [Citricoccus parietis]|uniref:Uncharacterized protein n=1 Tax=Citricoccus parietis TaxID=592307 RepID=A0ABV5G1I7_9MICC